jgi:hypothetical protein
MRRVLAWSIPLVLIAIGLLWPLVFRGESEAGPANDPVVFSNYRADFVVNADGRLDAVETITAEFPGGRTSHEKAILDHVTNARVALTSATGGKSVAERSAAEREFDTALGQVLALGQAYPQLNSSNNFLNLQQNLADTEDKLAFARQYYNDAVATSNRLISTIPWMFVAGLTGVSEREYYQTPR